MAALETGVFELSNTRVHQNLLLHHIGRSMSHSAILLRECQGHSSLDAPSELNPPQRIPSPLFVAPLVPQAEG